MQIRLLSASPAFRNAACRGMFAARKQVFVDLLKWDLPVLADRFEVDEFDTPDAEYLIVLDDHAAHRASARLLQTEGAHLLGKFFACLCDGPVLCGPSVREITRFCLDLHQSATERRLARNQLVTGLVEHALCAGITDYTGVAELSWFRQIEAFGWDCSSLGDPVRIGRQTLVALHIRINEHTLEGLRSAGVYRSLPVLRECGREALS